MKKYNVLFACALATFAPVMHASPTSSDIATKIGSPDATTPGKHLVGSAEYRFPASVDEDVLSDRMTEVWAKMFYPKDLITTPNKMPVILMLHGNHATCGTGSSPRSDTSCEYTYSGTCPAGYVPVPNHAGYDYIAKNLASWGYVVVSINANRGITCGGGVSGDYGLNLARGNLVLKHLSLLYKWSSEGNAPASLGIGSDGLLNKIDFSQVGLLGHSRGGEGVRAAYNLYSDKDSIWPAKIPNLSVKAIYEIGAVDGQTSRTLDANGTVWNQLLPMCDGDVSDLQGRKPYDRMMLNTKESSDAQKSLYEVWGTNHNFYNTEWQRSDAYGCSKGKPIFDKSGWQSVEQQKIALASVSAFFRSRLGYHKAAAFNQNFNPLESLPNVVSDITQVDRDFTTSPSSLESAVFEDFDKNTGINSSGIPNLSQNITIEHKYLLSGHPQRVANIRWTAAGKGTFFEAVWSPAGAGRDIHDFATLDFRISRQDNSLNRDAFTDFSIQLEGANGLFSNVVKVSEYAIINGPGTRNDVLKTVRIPVSAFNGIDLTKVHGVRFTFDKTETGALYLGNIRVQRNLGLGQASLKLNPRSKAFTRAIENASENTPPVVTVVPEKLNSISVVQVVQTSKLAKTATPEIEIRLASKVPFDVLNRLPVLQIGDKQFKLSKYSDPVGLKEMTFTLTQEEYKSISKTGDISIINGKIWKFGTLAKALK